MRVISQNRKSDIPYELFVFGLTQDNCIVAIRDTIARPSEMANGLVAKYSTEEKALKAMEMLRMAYVGTMLNVNCDITEDFETQLTQMMKHGFGVVCINSKENQCDFKPLNTVFQFPKDEEIEV